jgi:hypothetical protein
MFFTPDCRLSSAAGTTLVTPKQCKVLTNVRCLEAASTDVPTSPTDNYIDAYLYIISNFMY